MEDGRILTVTGMDLTVLLYHLHKFAEEHEHMDADHTLDQLTRKLSFSTRVPQKLVESGLFACNLLDEEGRFWDPYGASFDEFARKLGKGMSFNKKYNWFEEKRK